MKINSRLHSNCGVRRAACALLAAYALFATSPWAPAQTASFTNINAGLPGHFAKPSVAWVDYDNDGRLDIVVGGTDTNYQSFTHLYRNNGNGTFTWNTNAVLQGPGPGNIAWGDYDNDGDLDMVGPTVLYRNDGNGSFTNTPAQIPFIMNSGSFAWGDYDNDGRLDVLFSDYYQGLVPYRNNGDGTFTPSFGNGLPPGMFNDVSASWGDYDNDGNLDVVSTGSFYDSPVHKNNGDGTFTQNTNAVLPCAISGAATWGDADGDGWLDIFLSVWTGGARVYLNNRDGTFTWNTNADFLGISARSAAWGDYDNDGRLDLLLSGEGFTQVWRNNGDGSYTEINAGLPAFFAGQPGVAGAAAWGDYDQDGRLDVLLAGRTGSDTNGNQLLLCAVYRNTSPVANTPPASPAGLSAFACNRSGSNTTIRLSWNAATDAQTPSPALTYNVRVGTMPGGSDVVGPQADTATGRCRLPAWGNAQHGLTALVNLPYGDYYWSVQAVDTAFAGSAFSPASFLRVTHAPVVTTQPAASVASTSTMLQGTVNPRLAETLTWFEYGLTPRFGHQTPAVKLDPATNALPMRSTLTGLLLGMTYHYRLVASNAMGYIVGSNLTVTLLGSGQPANGPSLSGLTDLTNAQGTVTSIWFTVSDPDTEATQLVVAVQCNNPVLFPEGGLYLGGGGSRRSLTLTPGANCSGSAVIRVSVSDGTTTTNASFTVWITPTPGNYASFSPLMYLTNAVMEPGHPWRFRLVDAGVGATSYVFEYRPNLSPTNVWSRATNVTLRGAGEYEVGAGPPQEKAGFFRVKGLRPLVGGLSSAEFSGEEGANLMGPVLQFSAPYSGTVNYTWTSAGTVTNGSIAVNGTTAVIPLPITDNTGIDSVRSLTLRLEAGTGYGLAGTLENRVTVQENDADWQGMLVVPNGLAETVTVSLTNQVDGGHAAVALPQNTETSFDFTLKIQQSSNLITGALKSDGAGFFPTNEIPAHLTLTADAFYGAALNVPLLPLAGRPLLGATQYVSLGLVAANGQANQRVSPTEIRGVATLFTMVPGRPYLDTEVSGTFLLLKPAARPSTNEATLRLAP